MAKKTDLFTRVFRYIQSQFGVRPVLLKLTIIEDTRLTGVVGVKNAEGTLVIYDIIYNGTDFSLAASRRNSDE
jgi:hypothetical protein